MQSNSLMRNAQWLHLQARYSKGSLALKGSEAGCRTYRCMPNDLPIRPLRQKPRALEEMVLHVHGVEFDPERPEDACGGLRFAPTLHARCSPGC